MLAASGDGKRKLVMSRRPLDFAGLIVSEGWLRRMPAVKPVKPLRNSVETTPSDGARCVDAEAVPDTGCLTNTAAKVARVSPSIS